MSFFANNSGWPFKPLKDVAHLKRGYDLPTQDRVEGEIPIFAANGKNGTHNEAKIKGPGVITGRSGTIGKVHFTEHDYWPLNTALYVTDFKGNDPKWVYYMLQ
ncbi:MAG: restriction endonuclease subunit S, partial [Gammaproteobacteria bacterium]|nr:restriction endonuclease subunit S [Gammaproteobacteria bacterium]MBU1557170.1 restriction endonuclease subunit S [Gammaproteobacteria bacterium]